MNTHTAFGVKTYPFLGQGAHCNTEQSIFCAISVDSKWTLRIQTDLEVKLCSLLKKKRRAFHLHLRGVVNIFKRWPTSQASQKKTPCSIMQGHVLKRNLIHALEKLHEASFSSTSLDPSHI